VRRGTSLLSPARCVLAFVGAVVLVASCSGSSGGSSGSTTNGATPQDTTYPPRVALFGDSLAWEAEPYYTSRIKATGETALTYDSYGGTAICDWLPRMREIAATFDVHAAELQFSGNALTPCMQGYPPPTQAYYDKYRDDATAAINIFVPRGTHVFLVGAPITRSQSLSDPGWDRLNRIYEQLAAQDPVHVTYVDAGSAVEGPGHTFVQTLPCLLLEPCIGPVVDNAPSNTVRAPDGAHFCPVVSGDAAGIVGGCPIYSSGAFRYADAMVSALATPVVAARSP